MGSNFIWQINLKKEVAKMKWETPAFVDNRFGFEVTMYICHV